MKLRALARFCCRCALSALALLVTAVPAAGQAGAVTLAWDPSPEDFVAGYFVYVTGTPGVSIQQFDAASDTRFTYPDVVAGVGYYFAVAAYTSGGVVGPRSGSMFYMEGSPAGAPDLILAPAAPPASAPFAPTSPVVVCVGGDSTACYAARTLVTTAEHVTALAAFPDGRVAIVENSRQVRIIDPSEGRPAGVTALTVESPEEILGLAIDPAFPTTRAVFVSVVDPGADGRRRLTIMRYRELGDALGQGAPIITGISVPASGDVPFTVDLLGRLYVAVPGGAQDRRGDGAYASSVLRFEPDGRASPGNGGASPLFARGYARPEALAWDAGSATLWMSGRGAGWVGELAFVTSDMDTMARPRIPTPVPLGASPQSALTALTVDSSTGAVEIAGVETAFGALVRWSVAGRRASAVRLSLPAGLVTTLAGVDSTGARFAVVRDTVSAAETVIGLPPP